MTLALQKFSRSLNQRLTHALKHAAFWLVFMFYELTLLYYFNGHWAKIGDDLVYYVLNIGLFYVHAYWVLPLAFNRPRKRYVVCLLLILLELSVYLALKYLVDYFFVPFRLSWPETANVHRYLFVNCWRGLYFMGFGTGYWVVRRIIAYRLAIAEADKRELLTLREKTDVETKLAGVRFAFLQQQISPHFLFNTLNFMYNSVYKLSPEVSGSILQLSEMMRYSLRETDASGKTELRNEVEQIGNLIGISRLRYDFQLNITLECSGLRDDLKIIPLVLLTLAENVFKHGNLKNKDHPAAISLSVDQDGLLRFATWNLKKKGGAERRSKSLGLENTIKRLEYVYPGNYSLDIDEDAGCYQLELNLKL